MSTEKKRVRSKNFTDCDRMHLIEITADYLSIIENKKTDGPTVKAKNLVWDKVCNRFNKIAQTGERTTTQLKALYDSIKKRYRVELIDKKNDDTISISSVLQKYHEVIGQRSIELTNIFDNLEQFNDSVEEKDPLLTINENSKESINDNTKDTETLIMPSTESRDIDNSSQIRTKRKQYNNSDDEKEQLKLEILRIRKEKEEIERDILLLKKRELEIEIEEKIKKLKNN